MSFEELINSKMVLAAKVAQGVHVLKKKQIEVAASLGLDKATVSRLLSYAKQHGLFSVELNLPQLETIEVELNRRYKIDAIVVPIIRPIDKDDEPAFTRILGQTAARLLEGPGGLIKNGQKIGISCGATIREIVFSLKPGRFTNMEIRQLIVETEIEKNIDQSPFTLVANLRGKWGDPETKAVAVQPLPGTLSEDGKNPTEHYKKFQTDMYEFAKSLDVAIVGISSGKTGSFDDILKKPDIKKMQAVKLGMVGEILNRPYNLEGDDLFPKIERLKYYVDGVELEVLKEAVRNGKKVIAVAGGAEKIRAIHYALKSRFVSHLITDMHTGMELCKGKGE